MFFCFSLVKDLVPCCAYHPRSGNFHCSIGNLWYMDQLLSPTSFIL